MMKLILQIGSGILLMMLGDIIMDLCGGPKGFPGTLPVFMAGGWSFGIFRWLEKKLW